MQKCTRKSFKKSLRSGHVSSTQKSYGKVTSHFNLPCECMILRYPEHLLISKAVFTPSYHKG